MIRLAKQWLAIKRLNRLAARQYCPRCYSWRHPFWRAVKGYAVWHLVCRWWLETPLWWKWGVIPPFLATAGDWIYDTRGCGCGVPLERDA